MPHAEVTAPVTLVTTAETVIATITAGQIPGPIPPTAPTGVPTIIEGVFNILTGATVTAIVVRVRQNSLTGAVVGNADTHTIGAAANANVPFEKYDPTGAGTYVVTVAQTGASGNGTVNSVSCDTLTQ